MRRQNFLILLHKMVIKVFLAKYTIQIKLNKINKIIETFILTITFIYILYFLIYFNLSESISKYKYNFINKINTFLKIMINSLIININYILFI